MGYRRLRLKDTDRLFRGLLHPLQGLAIIFSRELLASGDKEAQARSRTDCLTTYQFAEFSTDGQYSDELADWGAPALLAHKCVIPVICNMSNKSTRHP